jgi:hypothetical protein
MKPLAKPIHKAAKHAENAKAAKQLEIMLIAFAIIEVNWLIRN